MNDPVCIPVKEGTQVGEARRSAIALASVLGFDESRRGAVGIVVTELATNLARHAKQGEILLRPIENDGTVAIEILSIDRGPGISNLSDAFRDGFSTSSTPGTGLGAVRRFANVFDVFTSPGGSVILAHLTADGDPPKSKSAVKIGAVCFPVARETACGDAWSIRESNDGRTVILVADGLGHGLHAAEASRTAVRLFNENTERSLEEILTILHAGLRSTRGAAILIVELRPSLGELRAAGVGNISGSILADGKSRSLISNNGTVGAEMHRVKEFTYPWPANGLLILHSDGLKSQWQLAAYAGLTFKHPSIIAGVLYRDFRRERDDVTVLAIAPTTREK